MPRTAPRTDRPARDVQERRDRGMDDGRGRGPEERRARDVEEERDRGVSAVEFAILAPILILTLLAVFQFAFYYYAREVTLAAAQSGARVARTTPGGDWQGAADQSARDSASKVGKGMLDGGVQVQSGQDGDQRWVEVSGKVVKVIPFVDFHVSQRSRGPIECFRPDVGSGTACQGGGAP
ncbi:TadE/TadG family type IV pilus assembly protein [Actinomadura oligospora]|uniref:TadE/TadG family type IV pilus assembly protein n=1 Tax=Actinomadura oligospora TaxID=111804 RepID=UPI0004B230AD|nr:TadE family protein [Actinomadura oligospora]